MLFVWIISNGRGWISGEAYSMLGRSWWEIVDSGKTEKNVNSFVPFFRLWDILERSLVWLQVSIQCPQIKSVCFVQDCSGSWPVDFSTFTLQKKESSLSSSKWPRLKSLFVNSKGKKCKHVWKSIWKWKFKALQIYHVNCSWVVAK